MEVPKLWTEEQTASYLGIKRQTLATWRWRGNTDLRWIKVGSAVRYRVDDVLAYLEDHTAGAA